MGRRMAGEETTLSELVQAGAGLRVVRTRRGRDFLRGMKSWGALGWGAGAPGGSGVDVARRVRALPMSSGSAGELAVLKRAEAPKQDMRGASPSPAPRGSMARTGGQRAAASPFRRPTSCGTRGETASPQARRVLRWRRTTGGCCVNVRAQSRRATGSA